MTQRSRLLRVVEAAERLPPALQPPFWGALLGIAVTAGLILASVPLWLVQGRADIPAAVLDMAARRPGRGRRRRGDRARVLAGCATPGRGGYYALWILANIGAALIYLGAPPPDGAGRGARPRSRTGAARRGGAGRPERADRVPRARPERSRVVRRIPHRGQPGGGGAPRGNRRTRAARAHEQRGGRRPEPGAAGRAERRVPPAAGARGQAARGPSRRRRGRPPRAGAHRRTGVAGARGHAAPGGGPGLRGGAASTGRKSPRTCSGGNSSGRRSGSAGAATPARRRRARSAPSSGSCVEDPAGRTDPPERRPATVAERQTRLA